MWLMLDVNSICTMFLFQPQKMAESFLYFCQGIGVGK